MSQPSGSKSSDLSVNAPAVHSPPPEKVFLVAYPKIVFLYPTFLFAIVAALLMHFYKLEATDKGAVTISTIFLGLMAVNLVILAFDFPRTTSLTLFFFFVAVVMGLILLFTFYPHIWPDVAKFLQRFHPLANSAFYWGVVTILGTIFIAVMIVVRFDYWEVRPNELLHHHGFLANLERLSAPNLRMEKEIPDVFEYMLLRSGRLIIQTADDRRAIVLDNVLFITQKEAAVTRMLGALQVQMRPDNQS